MANTVQLGDTPPDFELKTSTGEVIKLSDYRNKKAVIVFFYPKDGTPGCTKQVCSFRDLYADLHGQVGDSVEMLGISADSGDSHANFSKQHNLPFPLLSDPGNRVRKLWGVPKTLGLLPGRVTYVLDKAGVVRSITNAQLDIQQHVDDIQQTLRSIQP